MTVSLSPTELDLITHTNAARMAGMPDAQLEEATSARFRSHTHFAVYDTLGPGWPNHHQIADIAGLWRKEFNASGTLVQYGWVAAMGYPTRARAAPHVRRGAAGELGAPGRV
jgi:hypothetical protein